MIFHCLKFVICLNSNIGIKCWSEQIIEQLTISVTELSKVLGVSKPIAYRLANSKDFPVLQIGSRKVIPVKKLEKWLEENTGFVGGEK